MTWEESEHPRDGRGRFADKAGGWVAAVAARLGRRGAQAAPDPVPEPFEPDGSGSGFGGTDLFAAGRAGDTAQAALDAARVYVDEHGNELAGRMRYHGGGVGPHGDEALRHIAAVQSYDSLPALVSPQEMDDWVARGALELWRGVEEGRGPEYLSPDEIHRRLREGDAYQGLGMASNGTHFSSSRSEASTHGVYRRYALHPDAKVVGFRTAQLEQDEYLRAVGHDSVPGRVYAELGRYAAARGYDAVLWRRGEEVTGRRSDPVEVIVLNRGALLAEVD